MGEMLGPLVLFAVSVCFTPGPNVVMITASGANFGFRRAIPHILGITAGFGAMTLTSGLGLAGLFHAEPRLHFGLKYMGAIYLLYLAWRIARADAAAVDLRRARPIGFVEAVIFTWLNPKAWVSTIGALAAFTTLDGDLALQSAVIAGVLAVACLASCLVWAGFGVTVGHFLRSRRSRRLFNGGLASLLVLSLIPVLW